MTIRPIKKNDIEQIVTLCELHASFEKSEFDKKIKLTSYQNISLPLQPLLNA
ncbi:hypothetical protein [Aquimarina longa]|uniref:hypothetical protein n=1 Tax=Aquimarina longa TaxID=1080221 RepID=UPI000B31B672|nr:hypothetical protein [Aquimarina longa]